MADTTESIPDLSISRGKICFLIAKVCAFNARDAVTIPNDGPNPADDAMVTILRDRRADPVSQEIAAAIFAMSEDEKIDLMTQVWLGRSDGALTEWPVMCAEAARPHDRRTASYLLWLPLFADYLEEELSQFGVSCEE
jgi:Protein of unknown function (DUF3775)